MRRPRPAACRRPHRACPSGVLAAVLAVGLLAGCSGETREEVESSAPVPVKVAAVRRGTLHRVIAATGIVTPAKGAELVVTAPQPARIAALPWEAGQRVHRGDLLVRFDIPSLTADAAARRADVERARARLAQARSELARLSGLFERGIAARRDVEAARRELAEAEAGVAEAQSARRAAGALAAAGTVRAPFDGMVAERAHNPGDLVDPAAAEPVLRLIDPARLQVEVELPLSQLAGVRTGDSAVVRGPGGPDEPASVVDPPAAVDPATAAAGLRLALSPDTRLPAGAPVEVEIAGEERRDVVIAPQAAVVQEGPESFLYTVDGAGRAHRVPVRLGIAAAGEVEVASGLAAGERVIVEGQNGLPDGAAVTVERAP